MKWRCPQCGKPHERNDPPCDNCGHHSFERAVVPEAPETDREQFVWACTECGRNHQRNNPPCARCGNGTFEKQPLDYGDIDAATSSASYLDLVGRQELAMGAVAIALGTVAVLGFLGVISVPGLTPQGPPTVENVPGNATVANGIDLEAAEDAYLVALNERRRDGGLPALEVDQSLEAIARFYNRRWVKATYADGTIPTDEELQPYLTCRPLLYAPGSTSADIVDTDSAAALGESLAAASQLSGDASVDRTVTRTGIDMHVGPNGRLYVTQLAC